MLERVFKIPCPACLAAWDEALSARPEGAQRFEGYCLHHQVAATLRLEGEALLHYTIAWCPDSEAFDALRAYLRGGEAGVRAALEAESALRKAGDPGVLN